MPDHVNFLRQLPRWAIAFLAVVIAVVIIYATAIAQCTTEIFGLTFGPKASCSGVGGAIPEGTILGWDPILRSPNGQPTGKTRTLPAGWKVCDGKDGTPDLDRRFLMGVLAESAAGKPSGNNDIPSAPVHNHSGGSTDLHYRRGEVNWNVKRGEKHRFSHGHSIRDDGGHNHGGDNRPEFYPVLFLCRKPQP